MNRTMPLSGAHPALGEEVMVMDDVEVDVAVGCVYQQNLEPERKDERT